MKKIYIKVIMLMFAAAMIMETVIGANPMAVKAESEMNGLPYDSDMEEDSEGEESQEEFEEPESEDWMMVLEGKSWNLNGRGICDIKEIGGEKIIQKIRKNIDKNSGKWEFEAKITSVAIKKGYGKYRLTLQYGKKYGDAVRTTEFTVFPNFRTVWNPEKRYERHKKGKMYYSVYGTKSSFQHVDGIGYRVITQKCKVTKKKKGKGIHIHIQMTGREKLYKQGHLKVNKLVKFDKRFSGGEKEYQGKYYDNNCIIVPDHEGISIRTQIRPYVIVEGKKFMLSGSSK